MPCRFKLGHAHGIFSIGVLKLGYAFGEFQEQASEIAEVAEHEKVDFAEKGVLKLISQILVGKFVTVTACVVALLACTLEIIRDLRPSGHHGAALLAGSELLNQWYRLRPTSKTDAQRRRLLMVIIAIPAAVFALFEVYEDMRPGTFDSSILEPFCRKFD